LDGKENFGGCDLWHLKHAWKYKKVVYAPLSCQGWQTNMTLVNPLSKLEQQTITNF
jgi:hypothetical protein